MKKALKSLSIGLLIVSMSSCATISVGLLQSISEPSQDPENHNVKSEPGL